MENKREILKVVDLQKKFHKLEVLKGISTTFHENEVVSIIGPSGGGKSTFLRCLNLLEQPTSGQILFDGIIPAVKSGQVDLGIAAFTKTPERAEEIDFSDLYEKSAQLLIVKAGNADLYSTKESLAGQKVGAQKGTIQSQLIQTALPDSELFELEKYPALALEVQNGNIAGLVVDQAVGESLIATSNGGLEVSNFAFTSEEASFGKAVVAAKGSEDLLAEVNTVINQVVNDGSYLKAYDEAVELAASMGL